VQMPRALLLQQVFEAARGLLRVLLRRVLDSRDSVVWLVLAVGTRVVVIVATALVPVVAAAAARVLLALATDGIVLGVVALSSSSAQDVTMSLRWGMDLGRRRPKSSKVRRW
jgi:hypothetical protein